MHLMMVADLRTCVSLRPASTLFFGSFFACIVSWRMIWSEHCHAICTAAKVPRDLLEARVVGIYGAAHQVHTFMRFPAFSGLIQPVHTLMFSVESLGLPCLTFQCKCVTVYWQGVESEGYIPLESNYTVQGAHAFAPRHPTLPCNHSRRTTQDTAQLAPGMHCLGCIPVLIPGKVSK
jgi:hypothetical protein